MARIDSYYTDTLTVSGQVSLESQIISNITIPAPVGSTIQMTSDQYLVAATLGSLSTVNVVLPANPTIGETHVIKAYLNSGSFGTVNVKVSGLQKIDGNSSGAGFSQASIQAGSGASTNSSITLIYGVTDLWFVVAEVGTVNYS